MLAARHTQDPAMRDREQDLAATLARGLDGNGHPREGFYNLTRRMDSEEEDQFDVDLTINDFLVYKATAAVFEWQPRTDKYESDLPNALITMTAEWRLFLSQKHSGRSLSSVAAFRSRLLQFVLLWTHRYHPTQTWTNEESLQSLRQQNLARGTLWSDVHGFKDEHHSPAHLSTHSVESARRRRASDMNLSSSSSLNLFNNPDRPALDQLLPIFIQLTAARARLGDEWQPTSDWFDLAGQFMLQAVIDQYLINGHCPAETFIAIFAFGNPGAQHDGEGSDVAAMRSLFCRDDSPNEELPEWTTIRRRYIKEASAIRDLQKAEERHSYLKFESRLLSFLQHLHDSAVRPDLVQVEDGRIVIDGTELSAGESREMIERMRL